MKNPIFKVLEALAVVFTVAAAGCECVGKMPDAVEAIKNVKESKKSDVKVETSVKES